MIKSTSWGIDVIKFAFERLPPKDRLKVVAQLERITRKDRWQDLTQKVRRRARKDPISQQEIDSLCEDARRKIYARRIKNRH